jgi:hypothetical protein
MFVYLFTQTLRFEKERKCPKAEKVYSWFEENKGCKKNRFFYIDFT